MMEGMEKIETTKNENCRRQDSIKCCNIRDVRDIFAVNVVTKWDLWTRPRTQSHVEIHWPGI